MHSIRPFTHIFWSGGDTAKNGADYLANDVGGKTIRMTNLGKYLEKIDVSSKAWNFASMNFANQVANGGTVFSIQNLSGLYIKSTWAIYEYPILYKIMVEILYEFIGGGY